MKHEPVLGLAPMLEALGIELIVPDDVMRDALRYRWLKNASASVDSLSDWPHIVMANGQWDAPKFGDDADTAVDAAIAASPPPEAQA